MRTFCKGIYYIFLLITVFAFVLTAFAGSMMVLTQDFGDGLGVLMGGFVFAISFPITWIFNRLASSQSLIPRPSSMGVGEKIIVLVWLVVLGTFVVASI
jgi:hypothetical protein